MKTGVFLIAILLGFINATCQDIEIYGGIGKHYGYPDDLERRNDQALEYLLFPAEMNENFPTRTQWHTGMNIRFERFNWGVGYSYYSTGSRLSYSDYSGKYFNDVICVWNKISPSASISFIKTKYFRSSFYLSIPINHSKVTFDEHLQVYDFEDRTDTTFYSTSVGLSPGLEVSIHYSIFNITLRGMYLFNDGSELHEKGNKENEVDDYLQKKIDIGWTGYAVEVLLGIRLLRLGASP